jgi:hypothetical protein
MVMNAEATCNFWHTGLLPEGSEFGKAVANICYWQRQGWGTTTT